MAEVNAKKCDICGYVYEENEEYDDELTVVYGGVTCYDMCPRCHNKIMSTIQYLKQPKTRYSDKPYMTREEFDAIRRGK